MKSTVKNLFKEEIRHLQAADKICRGGKTDPPALFDSFCNLKAMYEKNINAMIKITEISDSQQQHLIQVQSELKKEVEERKKAEGSLGRSNMIIQTVLDNIEALIFVVEGSGDRLLFLNRYARDLFDVKNDRPGKTCEYREFLPSTHKRSRQSDRTASIEVKCGKNDRWYNINSSRITWIDGKEVYLQVGMDITERKLVERQLEYYAYTDPLTGISNRRTGLIILERALHMAARQKRPISACYVDLDGLKTVNDRYGHDEGDYMIVTVSGIVKSILRNTDIICRLGGDEFLLVFPDCSAAQADVVIRRIKKRIKEHEKRVVKPFVLSFSYGIMEYNGDIIPGVEEVIKTADEKMYQDKVSKKMTDSEVRAN